jgi:hypothetical protein
MKTITWGGIFFGCIAFFGSDLCLGDVFEVKNPMQLKNALSIAQGNGEEDLIKIHRGTYYGNFSYATGQKKLITLRGGYSAAGYSEDPSITVLDANNFGRVLKIQNGGDIVVENLSIRNGAEGGIYAGSVVNEKGEKSGNIVIKHTIIRDNRVEGYPGGGLWAESFAPNGTCGFVAVINSTISGNTASKGGGGAYIYLLSKSGASNWSNVVFSNTLVTLNNSGWEGGGVHIWLRTETGANGQITLSDSNFLKNNAGLNGGGVFIKESRSGLGVSKTIAVENNLIYQNTAQRDGGGAYIAARPGYGVAASIKLANNEIIENAAGSEGGGAFVYSKASHGAGKKVTVHNNMITKNTAGKAVGGLYAVSGGGGEGSLVMTNNMVLQNISNDRIGGIFALSTESTGTPHKTILTNNTISENRAANKSGGLFLSGCSGHEVKVYNNIIWNNEAPVGSDVHLTEAGSFSGYNNNYHGMEGAWSREGDNMDQDPAFVDTDDFHLSSSSPCIDAGTSGAPELPAIDIDGHHRIHGSQPDMGADEFVQTR